MSAHATERASLSSASSRAERLLRAIERASHHLPAQAPLEVFVHHNTLHAFQHRSFHDAVIEAEHTLGARGRLSLDDYRAALARGRISLRDLDASLREHAALFGALPEGLPPIEALARTILVHDLRPIRRAELEWRIAEHDVDRSLPSEIEASAREPIVSETRAWLVRALEEKPALEVAASIVGHEGAVPIAADVERRLRTVLDVALSRDAIARALDAHEERVAACALFTACRRLAPHEPCDPGDARTHRELLVAAGYDDPAELVQPVLIAACASFLDRGQAHWSMPDREEGFFVAWSRMVTAGRAVRPAWLADLGRRLRAWRARELDAMAVILELLEELGVRDELDDFIERKLLELPGWAGMFRRLETSPGPIGRSPGSVALLDFVAVKLVLDVQALRDVARRAGIAGPLASLPRALRVDRAPARELDAAWPLALLAQHAGISAPAMLELGPSGAASLVHLVSRFGDALRARIWHDAYERAYRDDLLRGLASSGPIDTDAVEQPSVQIAFCIDDRSESIRRHFEELSPHHQTYGTAGFFNFAIADKGIDDPSTFPLCPVVVQPRHRVEERPLREHLQLAEIRRRRRERLGWLDRWLDRASRSLVFGSLFTAIAGAFVALPLLVEVFAPRTAGRLRRAATRRLLPELATELDGSPVDEGDEATRALLDGFDVEESAGRVAALLENIGLTRGFAPLVALVGHDSSSVNNPHFAAYSCGACGGRSGGPNARLFARMANRRVVREALRARGIVIPDETVFIGGVHDTSADTIHFYDRAALSAESAARLGEIERALAAALDRNAHERCRRFESAPRGASPAAMHEHVEGRAVDLSQPRPELGHATNAACVVGRRALTRELFLDRRVFLVSYDPTCDETGAILERTLAAAVPVCAGINLEYYFSTTDNERFGAGTKLPHNVIAMVGVMNGASSDLRTGLPRQMIEIHEPIRLQLVVEASETMIEQIVRRQPEVAELAEGEWIQIIALDPETKALSLRRPGGAYVPWEAESSGVPHVRGSVDWYAGQTSFVGVARIGAVTAGVREDA